MMGDSDLLATIEEARRGWQARLDASPHRCACGARTLVAGTPCGRCEDQRREVERQRREDPLYRTLEDIPADFQHEWIRIGNPEMLQAPDGRRRLKDQRALDAVSKAIASGMTRMTFTGDTGTGKTLLGTAALIALVEKLRRPGRWISALALQASPLHFGEAPEVDALIRMPGPLLVDDVGQETIPSTGRSHVARVIFERHQAALPTLVTTGLTLELVLEKYANPGLRRRLAEPGRTAWINIDTGKT